MRANLVYLIFPTTHTKDTFCQYVFLSVKCTRRRRALHNFLEVVSVFLAGYSFPRFVEFGIYGELLFPLSILRDSVESNRKYHRKEYILHFVCTDKIAPSYQ